VPDKPEQTLSAVSGGTLPWVSWGLAKKAAT